MNLQRPNSLRMTVLSVNFHPIPLFVTNSFRNICHRIDFLISLHEISIKYYRLLFRKEEMPCTLSTDSYAIKIQQKIRHWELGENGSLEVWGM